MSPTLGTLAPQIHHDTCCGSSEGGPTQPAGFPGKGTSSSPSGGLFLGDSAAPRASRLALFKLLQGEAFPTQKENYSSH